MRSISKKTITVETGDGTMEIDYAILVEDRTDMEIYGISVATRPGGERDHIRGITPSAAKICQLYDLFVRNAVTPSSARYVVYDWLIT